MTKVIVRRPRITTTWQSDSLHPLLHTVYAARGIQNEQELERSLQHLIPFHALYCIQQAVECIYQVIKMQQGIVVVGDFDVDGATSSALAVSALKSFGAENISYLVPNRFEYGYGLTPEIVELAALRKPALIITVDNGIASLAGVVRAKELGIKVVITDHHLPGKELPQADAIVNPNQPDCQFSSKNLAGVGVIFYVMLALRSYLREKGWFAERSIVEPNMSQFLDLVALGTVADVVPLDQNNRILVYQGLARIRAGKSRLGIQALLEVAGRSYNYLAAEDLGFAVGPRLNAAGRLDDMSLGVECLLCENPNRTRELAVQLDRLNKERQAIEAQMQSQAIQALAEVKLSQNLPLGICLYHEQWHQGVVGIIASRIKDQYHRPVIAFAKINEQEIKGSARSVPGVHIRDVLDSIATRYPDLILKFGGHAMAAGISLKPSNYLLFCELFNEEIGRYLSEHDLQGKIHTDGELLPEYFNLQIAKLLHDAGPWGQAFPEPIFDNKFTIVSQRLVGDKHLKLVLSPLGSQQIIDGIAFNIDTNLWPNPQCKQVHAAYRLDINEYLGNTLVQILIEHFEAI